MRWALRGPQRRPTSLRRAQDSARGPAACRSRTGREQRRLRHAASAHRPRKTPGCLLVPIYVYMCVVARISSRIFAQNRTRRIDSASPQRNIPAPASFHRSSWPFLPAEQLPEQYQRPPSSCSHRQRRLRPPQASCTHPVLAPPSPPPLLPHPADTTSDSILASSPATSSAENTSLALTHRIRTAEPPAGSGWSRPHRA